MRKPPLRGRVIFWAVVALAIFVVILLVLVGVGVLRLASNSSPGTLTVSRVQWTILQGTLNGSTTIGWFGPSNFNYTYAEGFPAQVAAGSQFAVPLVISDLGGHPHGVNCTYAAAPFTVVSSKPTLPVTVPAGEDDAGFTFMVQTPNSPGAVFVLYMTVNGLPASSCPI
jgi:hypothetical protein